MASPQIKVIGLDHLVLTVASIDRTVAFYEKVLGMTRIVFGENQRVALRFGPHKINLHEVGREFEPKAATPFAGSGDLCFLVDDIDAVAGHLAASGVTVIEGPGRRSGARGTIMSYYIRDPDQNLIELSAYIHEPEA
ncbi:MAG TPA: VOC family protein [Hyphomicrobiaceae bacterium]|nr:VOC family protein [Hyphomicrobiaceae bacterium]